MFSGKSNPGINPEHQYNLFPPLRDSGSGRFPGKTSPLFVVHLLFFLGFGSRRALALFSFWIASGICTFQGLDRVGHLRLWGFCIAEALSKPYGNAPPGRKRLEGLGKKSLTSHQHSLGEWSLSNFVAGRLPPRDAIGPLRPLGASQGLIATPLH